MIEISSIVKIFDAKFEFENGKSHFIKRKKRNDISSIFRGIIVKDGGKGSGNFGHEGRPGKVGGSGRSAFMKYLDTDVLKNPEKHSVGKYIENGKLSNNRKNYIMKQ